MFMAVGAASPGKKDNGERGVGLARAKFHVSVGWRCAWPGEFNSCIPRGWRCAWPGELNFAFSEGKWGLGVFASFGECLNCGAVLILYSI